MTTVLVPLDRTLATKAALPAAERIARDLGADVVLLAIGELPETPEQTDEGKAQALRIFAAARPHFDGLEVRERTDLQDDAAAAILAAVDEEHADLVVMATGGMVGRTGVARPDVADAVKHAGVQVEVIEAGSEHLT
jgi:nucleotide-binding universal stress UspA family protein